VKRSYCIDSRSEFTVIALGVSLQNVKMDYLSSFFDCAGAVSGFPPAEAPAAFPETGAYSHEKEDTQEKWFFYDPLA
jgi:hypothetical protein